MVATAGSRSSRALVLEKYDVLEELGHGGMATVYRAHDRRLLRDVAIKVLHPHLRESREIAHRFAVEAKAVAKLRHPNIVEVYDVSSEDEGEQYLVVELVRGPTLRKILDERGALPPEISAAIVMELLAGIAHAHAVGVIHRDVKPENVLVEHLPRVTPPSDGRSLSSEGERAAVKLTDFGIAKLLDAQGVTSTGQVLGSPAHMAPEQIEGGDVDGRADVFGLGVLLYECMVGHLPFVGNNPAQVLRRVLDGVYASAERERPIVGKVWSQILDRALSQKPEGRYQDAAAMREALSAELGRLGMGAPKKEIEAWLDDPERWTAEHDARLITRLCELGAAARRRSDAVAAAADYNRALAYAPNDPSLLRIVASMQRSEARARLARRVAPLALGALVLGSGAYAVARAYAPASPVEPSSSAPARSEPSARGAAGSSAPRTATSTSAVARVEPSAAAAALSSPSTARAIASPVVARPAVTRTVGFARLRPAFGVRMSVDGAPPVEADPTKPFTVDDKAHALVFTCQDDLCAPKTMHIEAGHADVDLVVDLSIAHAKLFVEGEPSRSYGVTELPNVNVAGGSEVEIPMTSGQRQVHVFDRTDPDHPPQAVVLKAGKRSAISFKR